MINFLEMITFVSTLLGFGILLISFLELRKTRKKLDKLREKDSFTESDKSCIIKYYKLSMSGFSLISLMQLINIFLK